MAGTKRGAKKAVETVFERHGKDFYKKIGAKGGKAFTVHKKGFAANRELASVVGRIGGLKSKRKSKKDAIFN